MNKIKRISLLFAMLMFTAVAQAINFSNDAFVLVDVSGTMKNTQANNEARTIIQEILMGNFDISKWKGLGWEKNNAEDIIPSSILKPGSRFCLIPFGNMNQVRDRRKCIYENPESFNAFYMSSFPTKFNDAWTYLTLAKAFVGSVAVTDNVKKAYVLIYTDGRPESTKEPYDNFFQEIVDDLEYAGSNSFKKIGILRKKINSRIHYDVEIWEFTSYKTIGENGRNNDDTPITSSAKVPKPESVKIITPHDGKTKANPHKIKKDEVMTLKWTGGAGNIIVFTKDGDKYKIVPSRNSKDFYSKSVSGTNAKMTFYKPSDYKIEVRGNNGSSDTLFLSVSTPILPTLLIILLLLGIIVAAVMLIRKFSGRDNIRRKGEDGPNRDTKSSNNTNDDW